MYSLTFRICVITPLQYGQNRTAHTAGALVFVVGEWSQSSPACVVRGTACGVRWAWWITAGLSTHFHNVAIATQPVHRLQIRPIVHH